MKFLAKLLLTLIFTLFIQKVSIAQNGTLLGRITNQYNEPIENVFILVSSSQQTYFSSSDGTFEVPIFPNQKTEIIFRHISIDDTLIMVTLKPKEQIYIPIQLTIKDNRLEIVDFKAKHNDGYERINPNLQFNLPSPMGGAESIIKMYAGVSSVNELSSQYNVRGGNYDENLIYVNDIQIYRPFLVRSGNQEGLSFVNLDLTESVKFSAGGFSAQYGDKMSSVMDVVYKTPKKFAGSFSGGLLGGTAHIEGVVKDKTKKRDRFTYLVGTRFKSNAYLLNFLETKGEYKPRFFDTQMLLNWLVSDKFSISVLGNFAINQYVFIPQNRETITGPIDDAKKFIVYYEGQEVDEYQNYLGGVTLHYKPKKTITYKAIFSTYYAREKETYDILSQYWLKDVEFDLSGGSGSVVQELTTRGVGSYREHARNGIQALISSIDLRAEYSIQNHFVTIGLKAQNEIIDDHIKEWTMYDSSGYVVPGIFRTPGEPVPLDDPSRILSFGEDHYLKASNHLNTNRISGFIQDFWRLNGDSSKLSLHYGARFHYWDFNNEFTVSPRMGLLFNPKWKNDWSFWLKTGVYYQSPFYRELRKPDGSLNPDIRSQFSYQILFTADYDFVWWNRPFKFSAETYYKYMDRLISYQIDNVRIIYSGENDSKGYATGIDMKLSGEFIKGLESWITLSLMKTAQDLYNDFSTDTAGNLFEIGYIPRPTDQRFAINLFFQDHIPDYPQIRVHLNFVFSSGLPFVNPNSKHSYNTFRSPWYKRVDLGFSYIFLQQNRDRKQDRWNFLNKINNAALYLEVFNLLDISNVSSYSWVPDLAGQVYAIPNSLTPRLINLKLAVDF